MWCCCKIIVRRSGFGARTYSRTNIFFMQDICKDICSSDIGKLGSCFESRWQDDLVFKCLKMNKSETNFYAVLRVNSLFASSSRQILPYYLLSNLKTNNDEYQLFWKSDHHSNNLQIFSVVICDLSTASTRFRAFTSMAHSNSGNQFVREQELKGLISIV